MSTTHLAARMAAIAATAVLLLATTAHATSYTWNGLLTGTGLAWDETNWDGGPPNAPGDVANLTADWNSSTAAPTLTLGANRTLGALAIDDTGASGDVAVTVNSGNSLTFNNNGATAALTSAGAANVINAPLSLTDNLAVTATSALTLGGAVTGNGGITKTGTQELRLNAASSFSGGITLSVGTLRVAGSVLTGGGPIAIASGATLANVDGTSNNINNNAIALTVDGTLWASINGTATMFTVGSLSGASTGLIHLGRRVDSQNALLVNQTVDGEYAGIIRNNTTNPGRATFTKNGNAVLTLSGNNTHGGLTTVNAGTLRLGHNNALGFGGQYNGNNAVLGTTVAAAGTLDLNGCTVNEPITLLGALINGNGAVPATLDNGVAAFQSTATLTSANPPKNLMVSGGGGSGAAGIYSNLEAGWVRVTASGTGYTSAPTVALQPGSAGSVVAILSSLKLSGTAATIGGAGDLTVSAAVGENASGTGFTKTGGGTLRLHGVNTYTGPTLVSEGALGGTGTITGNVTVASGAAITVDLAAGGGLIVAGTVDLTAGNATLALTGTTEAEEVILLTAAPLSGAFASVTGVPEGYGIRYATPSQIVLAKLQGTLLMIR